MIRRRRVLSTLGVTALAATTGCLSRDVASTGGPVEARVSFGAGVLQPFTDEHPARIRLEFANETDDRLWYLDQESPGQRGIFSAVWGSQQDSDAKLLALRDDIDCVSNTSTPSAIPATPTGDSSTGGNTSAGCWRPPCEELLLYYYEPAWEAYPVGETRSNEYVVLDGMNDECLPTGTYTFGVSGFLARGEVTSDGETGSRSERYEIERRLAITIGETLEVEVTTDVDISAR